MDTAKRLAKFADSLDSAKLVSLADGVDRVLSSLSKVAQYVGVQGYWVRNQRCWSNCYRQKRASDPSKDAQSIWFECQGEYQDSINKDESDWDKYASSSEMVKTAEFLQTDERFAYALAREVNAGKDAGTAAFDIMSQLADYASHHYVEAAGQLLRIAEVLEEADPLLASEAGSISGGLVKEAQALNNMKGLGHQLSNWFRGRNDPSKFDKGNMLALVNQLDNTLQGYVQQKNKITQMLQGVHNGPAQPVAQQMAQLLRGVLSQQTIKKLKGLAGEFDKHAEPQAPAAADPLAGPELGPESRLMSLRHDIDDAPAAPAPGNAPAGSPDPFSGKRFYKGNWVPESEVPAEDVARMDSPVDQNQAPVAPHRPRKRRPAVAPVPAAASAAAKYPLFKLSEAL